MALSSSDDSTYDGTAGAALAAGVGVAGGVGVGTGVGAGVGVISAPDNDSSLANSRSIRAALAT